MHKDGKMKDYNDGKWHGWNGGECPVHPKSRVETVLKDAPPGISQAENYVWVHNDCYDDIVAFRVIRPYIEPPKPREFWLLETAGQPFVFVEEDTAKRYAFDYGFKAVRVREVLTDDPS